MDRFLKVIRPLMHPIHSAGYPFIGLFAAGALLLGLVHGALGFLGLLLTAWCVYFFRDPVRQVPQQAGFVISPADGIVAEAQEVDLPEEIPLDCPENYPNRRALKVGVFMNVFDVHVNRAPLGGEVTALGYYPGSFLDASLEKASVKNERQMVVMRPDYQPEGKDEVQIAFVQIAGLVARRIICDLDRGQQVQVGERFGLIRFGSRVDVYLPVGTTLCVAVGQRMLAGQSVLAQLGNQPLAQWHEVRAQ